MCETCGCGDPEIVPVELQESLMAENDHVAAHNREHFRTAGLTAINLMGSPGSGKTALLEATAARLARLGPHLGGQRRSGDRPGRRAPRSGGHRGALDHHRLGLSPRRPAGAPRAARLGDGPRPASSSSRTSATWSVRRSTTLARRPASWRLAVTEGEDKPLKYPVMFRKADLVVLTKIDLMPHLPQFDLAALEEALGQVMPEPRMILTSAVTGEGIEDWVEWLRTLGERPAPPREVATTAAHSH